MGRQVSVPIPVMEVALFLGRRVREQKEHPITILVRTAAPSLVLPVRSRRQERQSTDARMGAA
jgi:hypothetical protein